ncbi:cell filamentation protein Fic [Candidatus Roizmanbacteria bacterium CG11_big_fil_rev_8_21_14_0_20_37_16]|uniref:Cell filamentation protein Fic n=1 Tax=Candidatus Roizmanbacteria bacterium CG11_big_fil_rev_8_21_14_0_20_37_16 TaxID=1974857 RepID=A0A2H0KKT4_9BACT|nr:MAG: cell filamentation protein Fic [Candidatus Roizmanbacteria bacterium CG11_big_fil_rev_8_21_14_0_20_37_16]
MTNIIGEYKQQPTGYRAFIPYSFPPKEGFLFDTKIIKKNSRATQLLGKLDGVTKNLPDSDFFLLMYLNKDAASSSQIEGTRATMIDAIEAKTGNITNIPEDVDDILHYIKALHYGIRRVTTDDFPMSLRFMKELHKELMNKARATHFSDPGEFRRSQNWIGGTRPDNARFVPPPIGEMNRALSDFELFLHAKDDVPPVIKSGILHAQFETIHPFLDGNGRTGRMLINFFLWKEEYLEKPVLFLSSYFKKHQELYYEKLLGYHNGKVQDWIDFFLDGVIEISQEAIDIVDKIIKLRECDILKISTLGKRAAESAALILPRLYGQPVVNTNVLQEWTGFSRQGVQVLIERFKEMGILSDKDKDKTYGQSYIYREYVNIFNEK